MTTPQKFRRLFAKSIDDIHITYFCPYCRKDHRHGSCNNFLDSRIENRSTHGDKCRGNIDIMICKDTTRKGLDSQQRLEMRVKRKQLEEKETKFFQDDYNKMMKYYAGKIKRNPYYDKQRLELDYCNSGQSKYEVDEKNGHSINHNRYIEVGLFSDIVYKD
jgi:hypothetical protein|tara:strand:- start:1138 stop:1620 length:483 start_codon:yes stop_codon:yes gene_type:complete